MRYFVDRDGFDTASPHDLRSHARELRNVVAAIERTVRALRQVSVHAVWESPSGETFAARVGETPTTLTTVANRLRGAADAITPYAALLEASQRELRRCDTVAHTASTTLKECDRQLEAMTPDDPDRLRVERERGRASRTLLRAERAYEESSAQAHRDESLVAVRLSDISVEADDPWGYDVFEGMSALGRLASNIGVVAKPIAVVGFADPLGRAGRRIFYDEGSFGDIAKSSVGYGLDIVSFGAAQRVSVIRHRLLDEGVDHVDDVPVFSAGPTRWTTAAQTTSSATAVTRRQRVVRSARPTIEDTLRSKTGLDDVQEAFDDWEAVAGAGQVAKATVVVKQSAKQGARVNSLVSSGVSASDPLTRDSSAARREREQQRRTATAEDLACGRPEDPREARVR